MRQSDEPLPEPDMVLNLTGSNGRPIRARLFKNGKVAVHSPLGGRWSHMRIIWAKSPPVKHLVPLIDAALEALKEER